MAENLSDKLRDIATTTGINLERIKVRAYNDRILPILIRMENDIRRQLDRTPIPSMTKPTYKKRRLDSLLATVTQAIDQNMREVAKASSTLLGEIGLEESFLRIQGLTIAIGADLDFFPLTRSAVNRIAKGKIMPERVTVSRQWAALSQTAKKKVTGSIEQGFLQGEPLQKIKRRLIGTRALQGNDGINKQIRRAAGAITQTAIQTLSNEVSLQTYRENQDIIKGIQWSSTLDSRTTPTCTALNGLSWKIGDGEEYIPDGHGVTFPGPTAHWGCRSVQVPITKSWSELLGKKIKTSEGSRVGIDSVYRKKLKDQGFTDEEIKLAVPKARASMDGQVSKDITFDKWLKGKGKTFTEDFLGKGKAKLFYEGKITTKDLITSSARPLSLAELTKLYG